MTKPYLTRQLERTADGVRITATGAIVTSEGMIEQTRQETRYRSESRTVYERVETRHEESNEYGGMSYTHSTFHEEPEIEWYEVPYEVTVPWHIPVYEIKTDDGNTFEQLRKGSAVVGRGDSLILLNYRHLTTGQRWARWLNVSTRKWQDTIKSPFPITPGIADAANRLRRDVEFDARAVLRGRTARMKPHRLDGHVHMLEGVVVSTGDGHAVVDFNGLGAQKVAVHKDYRVESGDLMQVVAVVAFEQVGTVYVMSNPWTWSQRVNETAIAAVRRHRSPARQHSIAAGGLSLLAFAFAGMTLGWSFIVWGAIGLGGMGASAKAAMDRRDDDAMAAAETAEVMRLRNLVERGFSSLADWNWRRIRQGF